MSHESGDLWVFGYGSLMWRPGFPFIDRFPARLAGYHRALCIYSHVHRGTPERPGLVLGLDRGGACKGVAFRVPGPEVEETIAYLRAREQATSVYLERRLPVRLANGEQVTALTYVADRRHPQYAGILPREALLAIVRQGVGQSGPNPEYVLNTYEHLMALDVHDATLAWLAAQLR